MRGIHQWPVDSPHKGQCRRTWMFSLIRAWTNDWANNRDAGDLKRHRDHYDVTVMFAVFMKCSCYGPLAHSVWKRLIHTVILALNFGKNSLFDYVVFIDHGVFNKIYSRNLHLGLTPGFNGFDKDNCKTDEKYMFRDSVCIILVVWQYMQDWHYNGWEWVTTGRQLNQSKLTHYDLTSF